MRSSYLVWGLVLTVCPAVWSAVELSNSARAVVPAETPAAELSAQALVQARTVGRTAPVSRPAPAPRPASLPAPPEKAAVSSAARAMVTVDAFREVDGSTTQLSGTGVVASRLGHIYVPYFVVRNADALVVTFGDGERVPARLLGGDQASQLAILKVSLIPDGIPVPDLAEGAGERAGRAVTMVLKDGSRLRELPGSIVGEKPAVGPLRDVLEVSIPNGVEVQGGILTDSRGTLVGLALASAKGGRPGRQSVLALPSSRIRSAVDRMVRGEPGTEAPQQVNLTVI